MSECILIDLILKVKLISCPPQILSLLPPKRGQDRDCWSKSYSLVCLVNPLKDAHWLHPLCVIRWFSPSPTLFHVWPILFFLSAGIFPSHVDLTQLQGLPPALLGQPLYPLSATGHPILPPRANTQMQLAAMQQQLQQQRPSELGQCQESWVFVQSWLHSVTLSGWINSTLHSYCQSGSSVFDYIKLSWWICICSLRNNFKCLELI